MIESSTTREREREMKAVSVPNFSSAPLPGFLFLRARAHPAKLRPKVGGGVDDFSISFSDGWIIQKHKKGGTTMTTRNKRAELSWAAAAAAAVCSPSSVISYALPSTTIATIFSLASSVHSRKDSQQTVELRLFFFGFCVWCWINVTGTNGFNIRFGLFSLCCSRYFLFTLTRPHTLRRAQWTTKTSDGVVLSHRPSSFFLTSFLVDIIRRMSIYLFDDPSSSSDTQHTQKIETIQNLSVYFIYIYFLESLEGRIL